MKKILLLLLFTFIIGISINGCATWQGVKKDSKRTWHVITA